MLTTTILGEAIAVQHGGIQDRTSSNTMQGITHGLIIGKFKRGRTDQPMRINKDTIKARLGYEPNNPFYQVVQDCVDRFPSVWVLRVGDSNGGGGVVVPPVGQISCEGATSQLFISPDLNYGGGWDQSGYDGTIMWSLEVDGVIKTTAINSNDNYTENYVTDNLSPDFIGEYRGGSLRLFNMSTEDINHRLRLIPSRKPEVSPELFNNPAASIDEDTGIISWCFAPYIAPEVTIQFDGGDISDKTHVTMSGVVKGIAPGTLINIHINWSHIWDMGYPGNPTYTQATVQPDLTFVTPVLDLSKYEDGSILSARMTLNDNSTPTVNIPLATVLCTPKGFVFNKADDFALTPGTYTIKVATNRTGTTFNLNVIEGTPQMLSSLLNHLAYDGIAHFGPLGMYQPSYNAGLGWTNAGDEPAIAAFQHYETDTQIIVDAAQGNGLSGSTTTIEWLAGCESIRALLGDKTVIHACGYQLFGEKYLKSDPYNNPFYSFPYIFLSAEFNDLPNVLAGKYKLLERHVDGSYSLIHEFDAGSGTSYTDYGPALVNAVNQYGLYAELNGASNERIFIRNNSTAYRRFYLVAQSKQGFLIDINSQMGANPRNIAEYPQLASAVNDASFTKYWGFTLTIPV